jgi:hypothetical protein
MMDTGRLKFENYNGILYIDAYLNGEFNLNDLKDILNEIRENYSPATDVILKRSGSYSVAANVQTTARSGVKEIRNLVYVVEDEKKRKYAEFASTSYMKPYNAQIASSVEEAFSLLSTTSNQKGAIKSGVEMEEANI